MARQLKLWNGRGICCYKSDDPAWTGLSSSREGHVYVAAYSRADVRRLVEQYCGVDPGETEIREYWSAGMWGNLMDGIEPERGLWLVNKNRDPKPIRLI
jgi:hypothetical protein